MLRFKQIALASRTVLALLTLAASARAGDLSLDVQPAARRVAQGGFVIATLRAASEMTGTCHWLNGRYPMFSEGESLSAVLPTTYDTPPGWHALGVSARRSGDPAEAVWLEKKVFVLAVQFPVQRVRMGKSKLKLYTDARIRREYALIGKALNSATSRRSWTLPFDMPVPGPISARYGLKRVMGGKLRTRHRGVDMAAGMGQPVGACAAGTVALAASDFILHGKTVVIDHGWGVCSLYLHLQEILTEEGKSVEKGETIGLAGSTGAATGPHLHFAVYVRSRPSDPVSWLKASRFGLP
jgi:murein DD-endopeptidase MepM/ murein hydrolase activator NlpD